MDLFFLLRNKHTEKRATKFKREIKFDFVSEILFNLHKNLRLMHVRKKTRMNSIIKSFVRDINYFSAYSNPLVIALMTKCHLLRLNAQKGPQKKNTNDQHHIKKFIKSLKLIDLNQFSCR